MPAADRIEEGSLFARDLEDGRQVIVNAMTFGKARLCIGDDSGIEDGWCYEDPAHAVMAAHVWSGEDDDPPFGWHRHLGTGRRRPDGDPEKEYIEP